MSSDSQPEVARGNDAYVDSLGLTICMLFVFAAIDGCIWTLLHSMRELSVPEPVGIALVLVAIPLVTAQVAFAAIWLVYAWPPLPVRLVTALVPVIMVAALFWDDFSLRDMQNSVVGLCWFTLALALPCGLARAIGCEVKQFRTPAAQAEWQTVRRPRQFTLRQMFAWTSAVALLGGLGRLTTVDGPTHLAEWLILAIIALVGGGFAQAAVWSALGERDPWFRLSGFAALAFGLGFIIIVAMTRGSPAVALMTLVFPAMVYATGGVLMIFPRERLPLRPGALLGRKASRPTSRRTLKPSSQSLE